MKMTSTICLTLTFLLGISISSLASITGAGDFEHNSEFLFGWSGGSSYPQENELDLVFQSGGTATLDTNTNNFTVGVRNQGWWNREGNFANAQDTNDNYFVGDLSNDGTQLLNNFFTFDISNLSGTVVGATLQLVRWHGGSDSGATSHTYSLYDVTTDAAVLNYNVGYSTAIYDDLGSGVNYGDFVVSVAGSHLDVLDFSLNANALADLNTAIGNRDTYFSIGGTLLPGQGGVIPEPITFVVWLLLGFCGLGIARYRMRCRADS